MPAVRTISLNVVGEEVADYTLVRPKRNIILTRMLTNMNFLPRSMEWSRMAGPHRGGNH